MKIAIASDDGQCLAAHTGRAHGFVIYTVENQQATRAEYRRNDFTAHAQGRCADEAQHQAQHAQHSHAALLNAIGDCCVLVTGGLGPRLVADLAAAGIDAYVCSVASVEQAAQQFAAGQLPRATASCACRHGRSC